MVWLETVLHDLAAARASGCAQDADSFPQVGVSAPMKTMPLGAAFTLLEPGPVVLVTTSDGEKSNVMSISWTMVIDFTPVFAITTGPWNYSYAALRRSRECVIAIPTVDLIDQVVGVGTCSGADTDKFARFGLTPVKARRVRAPLIGECLANIECRVVDIVRRHQIVVLEGVAAYLDSSRKETRTIHSVGDGTFVVDGRKLDRRKRMRSKIPEGV
jgi:flavin reductase (DIM6/NTAB) family NADH-FMN oxidoreductase RutF